MEEPGHEKEKQKQNEIEGTEITGGNRTFDRGIVQLAGKIASGGGELYGLSESHD